MEVSYRTVWSKGEDGEAQSKLRQSLKVETAAGLGPNFGRAKQGQIVIPPLGPDSISAPLLNVIDTNSCITRYMDSGSTIVHEYPKVLGEMTSIIEELRDEVVSGATDALVASWLPLHFSPRHYVPNS